jgi:hypothetical protein
VLLRPLMQTASHIHLDGERSTLSYEGGSGGLYFNKDRLSLRTPFGKFDIDW